MKVKGGYVCSTNHPVYSDKSIPFHYIIMRFALFMSMHICMRCIMKFGECNYINYCLHLRRVFCSCTILL